MVITASVLLIGLLLLIRPLQKTVFICYIAALSFWRPIILKRIISE